MYKFLADPWKEWHKIRIHNTTSQYLSNPATGENVSLAVLSNRVVLTTFDSKILRTGGVILKFYSRQFNQKRGQMIPHYFEQEKFIIIYFFPYLDCVQEIF